MRPAQFVVLIGCALIVGCARQEQFQIVYKQAVTEQGSSASLPASVLTTVPFATQAPLQNWDALHEEACEEASLILVHHFLQGTTISPERMEIEIQNLIAWEEAHGYKQDVTIEELGKIAQAYYGHLWEVQSDVSVASLKAIIAKGHPVIIPAAGRDLGNPYYSGASPWYHMLVLKGYDQNGFITNDVGTKRGEGYHYDFSILLNAIHDWTGVKEEIRGGRRAVLVVKR